MSKKNTTVATAIIAMRATSGKSVNDKRKIAIDTGAKAGLAIHDFLMEAICHAAPIEALGNGHGDVRVLGLDNFLTDMHQSQRTASIKQWVRAFTPIRWDEEGKAHVANEGMKKPELWDLKEADAHPFYEKAEELAPAYKGSNIEKTLERNAKQLLEACTNYAAGFTHVFKDDFKPAKEMRIIAQMQKALNFKVTADPSAVLAIVQVSGDDGATIEVPEEQAA